MHDSYVMDSQLSYMMPILWRTHMRVKSPPLKLKYIHQMKKNITKGNTNQKMKIGLC